MGQPDALPEGAASQPKGLSRGLHIAHGVHRGWAPIWLLHWAARRHGSRAFVTLGLAFVMLAGIGYVLGEPEPQADGERIDQASRGATTEPDQSDKDLEAARVPTAQEREREQAERARQREAERARRAAAAEARARARAEAKAREEQERRCTKGRSDAFVMSTEFVKRRLKAPGTAAFPWAGSRDVSITPRPDCTYEVVAYVDSQNSFGAMLRQRYIAVVAPGERSWKLRSLRFLE